MSGGAFDYQCFRISEFARELQEKIDQNDVKDEYDYCYGYSDKLIKRLQKYQKLIEQAGEIAYEIEWLYSGDTGEESFVERLKAKNIK